MACSQSYTCRAHFALAALALTLSPPMEPAAFTDVSATSGIGHIHSLKSEDANQHAGAAAVDVDGDGLADLIFARYKKSPILYRNRGDGTFVDETNARGLSGAIDAASFGAGDFDNDGDVDLFIAPHQGGRFFLYVNDGEGHFTEEAVARGAAVQVESPLHASYSIGLVDYDLDGYLDIYISEWGIPSNERNEQYSALLRNRGSEAPGFFDVATAQAGLTQPAKGGSHYGFASGWADFDGDGWPDLALIADFGQSQMYWNNGDGTFTNATRPAGVGLDENGMGIAVADYDGDGLLDFYVTSRFDAFFYNRDGTHTGNKLYRNLGNRKFEEVAVKAGASRTGWGWGAAFLDFDNDSDFDLLATNGSNLSEGGNPMTTPYVPAANDPTTLFENRGDGSFANVTSASGIHDTQHGKAVVVLDMDNDGDEDVIIVNSFSPPVVYRNESSDNGNDWIRFTFEGTRSNRDGIGALVRVTDNGMTRTLYYNPSNAYIGQREAALQFGLGQSDKVVDRVVVRWPTGIESVYEGIAANQLHHLIEPEDAPVPPRFTRQPRLDGPLLVGERLELEVEASGHPQPVFVWEKNGLPLEGAIGPRLEIKSVAPYDAGEYRAKAINSGGEVFSQSLPLEVVLRAEDQSIARHWNEFLLEAIRKDLPDPTKHSRNLYHLSAAMWDAFWAYEEEGWSRVRPVFHREEVDSDHWQPDRLSAQSEAISHAAYTLLSARYQSSPGAARTLFGFRWLMEQRGYDPDNISVEGTSPAAVGNRIGAAVLTINYGDGANELGSYADTSAYAAVNEPLVTKLPGAGAVDLNRWQPLALDYAVSQNGIPIGSLVQSFIGVNWRAVRPFALRKSESNAIEFDPGPPPLWGSDTEQEYVAAAVEVIRFSSYLDPSDGAVIDISPSAYLNNPLGANSGLGRARNPYTGQPYPPNPVKRGDYGRILAEFWADGPASETPPGHWNTLHNQVTRHPQFERRYMGVGPELSLLEWDIRAYLALNGGMHDAAVAAWTLKRQYDYARPITMIRGLAARGQRSDPALPSYDPHGLPLEPGLIELVTVESSAAGERHEHLAEHLGKLALRSWRGQLEDTLGVAGGVGWILAENWMPYQRDTFVSPAFAGYVSGHSTFSRSGAEIMTLLTGSPYFPGGIGEYLFRKDEYLEFEDGPSEDVRLQWATYYDAADQAGLSRLYGGIHVRADDFIGRALGARIGVEAFLKAHALRNGTASGPWVSRVAVARSDGRGAALLARFEAAGEKPMPLRRLARAWPDADGAGLGLLAGADGAMRIVAQGDELQAVVAEGWLGSEETLQVELRVDALEPVSVLACGVGPSLAGGAADVALVAYREHEGSWEEIGRNDNWLDHDQASRSVVQLLRGGEMADLLETEAALPLLLAAGRYRLELSLMGDAGWARLIVRGQSWADADAAEAVEH